MEALKPSSHRLTIPPRYPANGIQKPTYSLPFNPRLSTLSLPLIISSNKQKFKRFSTTNFSTPSIYETCDPPPVIEEAETQKENEKFDWYSQWYPIAPICDLDKRVPHGRKVMGLDVVVWWDKNEGKWQVFKDSCPHRMAPLSEGRIDPNGRLQCVYHGWCFNGAGDCKFIPQAPRDGPPVHTSKKACVAAYPCIEQNKIIWFWPSTEPQYKDIATKRKPPYIPEIDDPSYSSLLASRDFPYGYEVMVENLLDPTHVPYAHYKILPAHQSKSRPKVDREGGIPMEINVNSFGISGFLGKKEFIGYLRFIPPCVLFVFPSFLENNGSASSVTPKEELRRNDHKRMVHVLYCIPVSPGKSRVIWTFPRNYGLWIDQIIPRWVAHVKQHLILDSDLMLLHLEEHKLMEAGPTNWHKACYVPTVADAQVVTFRKWLRKYSNGQVDWGMNFSGTLPPSLPREQLMDRYLSHVVNCSSCRVAVKGFKALEVALQVISLASIGIVAVMKQSVISTTTRIGLVCMAILCFAASKWLSLFIHKSFYVHDYNHGLV